MSENPDSRAGRSEQIARNAGSNDFAQEIMPKRKAPTSKAAETPVCIDVKKLKGTFSPDSCKEERHTEDGST